MDNNQHVNEAPEVVPDKEAPVQTAFAEPPQKRRSSRLIIAGAIAAALVVIGGGSAVAYTQWYQNPDKVVHDAILNTLQAKTISARGTLSFKDDGIAIDLSLSSKTKEAKGEFAVNANIVIDNDGQKNTISVNGSGKMIDETLYVKVSGIKDAVDNFMQQANSPLTESFAAIVDTFEDKWISISPSDYKELSNKMSKQQECFSEVVEKIRTDTPTSNEVMNLYRKNQILVVTERLGARSVEGVGSLGYRVDVDKDATESFIRSLGDTAFGKQLKDCDDSIDFNKAADDVASSQERQDSDKPRVELWVSRFGHHITEFSLSGKADSASTYLQLQPTFDEDVTIETPADATPLKEVIDKIQDAIMRQLSQISPSDDIMPADGELDLFRLAA